MRSLTDRFDGFQLATTPSGLRMYFNVHFHRSAFDDHPLSVRAMLEESTDHAQRVGAHLKAQMYGALRHLA